jgi:hypothetical protein
VAEKGKKTDDGANPPGGKGASCATRRQSIKLRRNRRTTLHLPRGCTLTIVAASSDGKPAVLVEYPDGTRILHELLTPAVPPA